MECLISYRLVPEYIEKVGTAVNDWQYSTVVHIAKAVSAGDLHEKVVKRYSPSTLVPSDA